MHMHSFSVSQLKTARMCLRKWWLQAVIKATPDYTEDSKALWFGRAYHKSLELGIIDEETMLEEHERLAAFKAAEKTKKELENFNFTLAKSEVFFAAYHRGIAFRGYIDAIGNLNNEPCFAEFKTASQLAESDRLCYDLQVLFYVHFSGLSCEHVVYHQLIKPQIRLTKSESAEAFAQRFVEKAESKLDIIHVENLASKKECEEQLDELLAPCLEVLKYNREPKAIYTQACSSFGKPCPFWSYCYGSNRQKPQPQPVIEVQKTIEITF